MADSKPKIAYLDVLRSLAMLGVIVIHIASPAVNMAYGKDLGHWWAGNIFNSSVRFAVSLFLMLSGATLFARDYVLSDYFRKRFSRVALPFVFWLMIYWVYRWWCIAPQKRPADVHSVFDWAVNLFLNEGVSKHFWYIYMILFLYLLVPFVGKFLRRMSLSALLSFTAVWIILLIIFQSAPFNAYNWQGDYGSKIGGYLLFSGYMLMGYVLTKIDVNSSKIRPFSALIYVATVLVAAVSTYINSENASRLTLSNYGYLSINTVVQSVAVFTLFMGVSPSIKIVRILSEKLSDYGYGIYLVHIIVIGILFRNDIYWKIAHPIVSVPLLVVAVAVISFIVIYLMRKVPGLKHVSG